MWLLLSLLASLFWGLNYVIGELVFKKISVPNYLAIVCLFTSLIMFSIGLIDGTLQRDIKVISHSPEVLNIIAAGIVTFVIAEILIGFSITAKNATLAGLIEISYPFFIALFSYLLLKEKHFNLPILLGGLLICIGIATIYANTPDY